MDDSSAITAAQAATTESSSPPPTETEPPEPPEPPQIVATTTIGDAGVTMTRWAALGPGDCITEVPEGDFETVEVVECSVPNTAAFVGRSLSPADPATACANLFKSFVGVMAEEAGADLVWIEASSDAAMTTTLVVCLGVAADGASSTTSFRP